MPNYQLRLSRAVSDPNQVNVFIGLSQLAAVGECVDWICFEHEEDVEVSRTHVHVYYFNYAYKEKHFRDSFKNLFADVNKTDYAIATTAGRNKGPITIQGAIKYGSRNGKLPPFSVRGFDRQYVDEVMTSFRIDAIPAVKIAKVGIQQKQYARCMYLLEECRQFENTNGTHPSNNDILSMIFKYMREQGQVLSDYKIKELITTMRIYRGEYELLRNNILNNLIC